MLDEVKAEDEPAALALEAALTRAHQQAVAAAASAAAAGESGPASLGSPASGAAKGRVAANSDTISTATNPLAVRPGASGIAGVNQRGESPAAVSRQLAQAQLAAMQRLGARAAAAAEAAARRDASTRFKASLGCACGGSGSAPRANGGSANAASAGSHPRRRVQRVVTTAASTNSNQAAAAAASTGVDTNGEWLMQEVAAAVLCSDGAVSASAARGGSGKGRHAVRLRAAPSPVGSPVADWGAPQPPRPVLLDFLKAKAAETAGGFKVRLGSPAVSPSPIIGGTARFATLAGNKAASRAAPAPVRHAAGGAASRFTAAPEAVGRSGMTMATGDGMTPAAAAALHQFRPTKGAWASRAGGGAGRAPGRGGAPELGLQMNPMRRAGGATAAEESAY